MEHLSGQISSENLMVAGSFIPYMVILMEPTAPKCHFPSALGIMVRRFAKICFWVFPKE